MGKAITPKMKAKAIVEYYEKTQRNDFFDLKIHPLFAPAYELNANLETDDDDLDVIDQAYVAINLPDGPYNQPPFPPRYLQGGLKVGTTTWIFMGRKDCQPELYKDWVILSRRFDGATYWAAFHPSKERSMSAMTGDDIGPAMSKLEVIGYINEIEAMKAQIHEMD